MIPLKDNLLCRGNAPAVLFLIVANCLVFLIELMVPQGSMNAFFDNWAVVPAKITEAFTSGNPALIGFALLSVLTAMFLHGSLMHLVGNMIFLNVFGRAVENRLGALRFLAFYFLGGVVAWGFHYITEPMSEIPGLGASGAIAAVLGGYLLFYPKSECTALVIAGFVPLLVTIRAYWFLLAWFVSQLLPGISTMIDPSHTGIAYWAHIGGFMAGVGLASLWAAFFPVSDICYSMINGGQKRIRLWIPFISGSLFEDEPANDDGQPPCGPNCNGGGGGGSRPTTTDSGTGTDGTRDTGKKNLLDIGDHPFDNLHTDSDHSNINRSDNDHPNNDHLCDGDCGNEENHSCDGDCGHDADGENHGDGNKPDDK